jgi:hypothetical protein
MTSRRHEFTAAETADLLDELDVRLRRRGVAASIFVVGGAAIAAKTRRDRATEDVDALTRDTAVLEEANGAGPGTRSARGLVEPERRHVLKAVAAQRIADDVKVARLEPVSAPHVAQQVRRDAAVRSRAARAVGPLEPVACEGVERVVQRLDLQPGAVYLGGEVVRGHVVA